MTVWDIRREKRSSFSYSQIVPRQKWVVVKSFLLPARPFIAVKTPVFFTERKYCCSSVYSSSAAVQLHSIYHCLCLLSILAKNSVQAEAQATHILSHSSPLSHILYSSHVFTSKPQLECTSFFFFFRLFFVTALFFLWCTGCLAWWLFLRIVCSFPPETHCSFR